MSTIFLSFPAGFLILRFFFSMFPSFFISCKLELLFELEDEVFGFDNYPKIPESLLVDAFVELRNPLNKSS